MTKSRTQVLVIGAGLGGIATAARLARLGCRVTVVEKCTEAGGRCGRLVKEGHHFDVGATLFLMPEIYARTFADLGERMEDHLELLRVDPTYHLHFDDGLHLALTADASQLREQLEAVEPGSFDGLLRYLHEGRRHYELSVSRVAGRRFRRLSEYASPRNLLLFLRLKGMLRHHHHVGSYFTDDRLKAAFTFQDMYLSLSPYEAPATFSLLQYSELADGVWLPRGGMYRVIEAMTDIAKAGGVEFIFDAEVSRIDVSGRRAIGVTLADGRRIRGDVVVANADLPYVYLHLLSDHGAADRLLAKEFTCSAIVFFWGVDRQYQQLGVHNLFLVNDFRQSLDAILKAHTLPDEPILYIHAPARIDPTRAPEGADSLAVVVPVGHIDETARQDWPAMRQRAREHVFDRLAAIGVEDLRRHIKFEVCWTPRDWRLRFNLIKGATHGLGHGLRQMGYLRPGNRHDRYENLYFVGASTHPGSGLPSVLMSAEHVSERILEEMPGVLGLPPHAA